MWPYFSGNNMSRLAAMSNTGRKKTKRPKQKSKIKNKTKQQKKQKWQAHKACCIYVFNFGTFSPPHYINGY